jgi:hypothetical protein
LQVRVQIKQTKCNKINPYRAFVLNAVGPESRRRKLGRDRQRVAESDTLTCAQTSAGQMIQGQASVNVFTFSASAAESILVNCNHVAQRPAHPNVSILFDDGRFRQTGRAGSVNVKQFVCPNK